uniref:Uncharacterized protein n=1 Tax=Callorhinchus milii TaxID=7868 RepID=A0A4W3I896_CALMI
FTQIITGLNSSSFPPPIPLTSHCLTQPVKTLSAVKQYRDQWTCVELVNTFFLLTRKQGNTRNVASPVLSILCSLYVLRGLIPYLLSDVVFLWSCNLLSHLINTYVVDDNFSHAAAIRSYTKFVMGIAVSIVTYPFLLAADLMAVNNCGLAAGLPPYSPVYKSWIHCWEHLSGSLPELYRVISFSSNIVKTEAIQWLPSAPQSLSANLKLAAPAHQGSEHVRSLKPYSRAHLLL